MASSFAVEPPPIKILAHNTKSAQADGEISPRRRTLQHEPRFQSLAVLERSEYP
jgi:hypothetical protein